MQKWFMFSVYFPSLTSELNMCLLCCSPVSCSCCECRVTSLFHHSRIQIVIHPWNSAFMTCYSHILICQIYTFRGEKSLINIIVWFVLKKRVDLTYLERQILSIGCKPLHYKILTNVKKRFPTHLAEQLKYSHQFCFSYSWKVHLNRFTLFKISRSLSMFLFSSTELSALLCSLYMLSSFCECHKSC